MLEKQEKFHLEEYKELRKEIIDKIAKAEALVQSSAIVCAAVFSWLVVQEKIPATLAKIAWYMPAAVVVIAGFVGFAQYWRVKEMGEYLKELERALGDPELGWEKFLSEKKPIVALGFSLAWGVLLGGALWVAYVKVGFPTIP